VREPERVLRDDFTRRILAFALLGMCAVSLRLAWGISGQFPIHLGAPAFAQQQGGGCTPLTEIEGRGDQQSEPFRIAGQSFRVVFEADNPGETDGYAFFNVIDENDGIVQPDSQDLSSDSPTRVEGEATFSSGPGEYAIEIASEEASYTLTVEDCDGSSAVRTASQRPVALPRAGQADTRRLLEAGGPTDGPVPAMPGGGCPKEYPVERSGACYE
jgi:hypothetical protein